MPLYEYILPDKTRVVRQCSVAERDSFPGWTRVTVPETVRILTGSAPDPMQESMLKGYKAMEEKGGFRSEFSKEEIKRAWAT
jgi:hypothetical protein